MTEDQLGQMRSDFRAFLWYIWKFLGLPPPTPVQLEIAEYLQTGAPLRMVQAFRGVGKSWITSAYVVWRLWLDPQEKILVVSASKQRADDFSIFTKKLIEEVPFLRHLKAKPNQRDSNVAFDVGPSRPAHAPSVKSIGIFGQMAGSRADLIVADDVEVPNTSETLGQRERLETRCREFAAIRTHEHSETVFLGTPQTEESLYSKLPEKGYDLRIWPAEVPTEAQRKSYLGLLGDGVQQMISNGTKPGTPTDPDRFDAANLSRRRAEYGARGYAMQFQLDCSLSDVAKFPLKLSDLVVMPIKPDIAPNQLAWSQSSEYAIDWLKSVGLPGDRYYKPFMVPSDLSDWSAFTGAVMAIDPSGRGKDETGFAIGKMLNGMIFCPDAGGIGGGYSEATLITLAKLAAKHSVNEIVIEDNFGDGMWTELFRPVLARYHDCLLTEVHSKGQKELRIIEALEPVLSQHRLVVDENLISRDYENIEDGESAYAKRLFYQLTRITRDRQSLRHDDRVEALSMMVAYWQDQLGVNVEDAAREKKEEALMKDLEDWAERTSRPINTQNYEAREPTWQDEFFE